MFYVHSSRFGPRPSTSRSLTQLLIEENFNRLFTRSEYSSRKYSASTSDLSKEEEPYVTSPATTPVGYLSRSGSRSEKGSLRSVFRIESIDSARQTPSLGSVDDYPDDLTPRGSITPVQDEINYQDEEFDNFSPVDREISDFTKISAKKYDFLESVGDLLEPQQSPKEQEEINEEFASFNEVDDLISPLDVTTKLAKEYDALESVDNLLESLQTPKKFCSNLELSEGSRQKHEYLSRAPPPERLIMSSNPSPFDRAISREPSFYETPFTSTQASHYSAAENLSLISREPTIQMEEKKDEDITTSRVITEHVSMITTGYVSPPPGISSSILYESFDRSEAAYSPNDQSDEEELKQFSRSDTVRRSILPGQKKHHFQTTPPLIPKVLDETRAPSVKSVEEEVKEFPKVMVESPPRLGALEGFPRVMIPENPVPSPEIEEEFIYEKEALSPPPSPVKEEKATQIPKYYTTNEPSSSYILEETTTTESMEETTTESFTDNINVKTNFRARSPLAFSHRTQFEYSHIPLRRDGGSLIGGQFKN